MKEQHESASDLPRRIVSVYKSCRKEEMYLFVDKRQGLSRLPDTLQDLFGKPELVFDLLLSAGRNMARSNAREVLISIAEKGYFLQMPPPPGEMPEVVKVREMMPAKGPLRRNDHE
jgi:uncharacterized protein